MKRWLAPLGPGLMLAASAVGVSHLVQSTRVGSDYGLSLAWVIVVIAVLKYPAFRFAVTYSAGTGRDLVQAYTAFGRVARAWLFLGFFVDMFIATAAVALVTAGLLVSIFGLASAATHVALAVVAATALLLANGSYGKAERLIKLLVAVFATLTLLATLAAIPDLGRDGRPLFAAVDPGMPLLVFLIAVMGWMPLPMTGSLFLSQWVTAKQAVAGAGFDHRAAVVDLRIGWILTAILALCFVLLGTAVLFGTPREVPGNAGQFATEFLGIFTTVVGHWAYPVIALAAVAVMWSTVFALMDALPRVMSRLVGRGSFNAFLALQVGGVAIVLLVLMRNFSAFIDFATGTGFVTAPALAWYNFRAATAPDVPAACRPGRGLVAWHWVGFAAMSFFAIAFLLQRFELGPFAP